jgi:hypothetical protein
MNESDAKERLLETENLTDMLEDDDANWLLEWGTGRVGAMIAGIADDDEAGDCVNQLMKVMRSLNQISGDLSAVSPSDLDDEVRTFVDRYNSAFGTSAAPSDDEITALAKQIAPLKPRAAMQALLESMTSAASTGSTSAPAGPPAVPPAVPPAATTPTSPQHASAPQQEAAISRAATPSPQPPAPASATPTTTGTPKVPPAASARPETPAANTSKAPPSDEQQRPTSTPPGAK